MNTSMNSSNKRRDKKEKEFTIWEDEELTFKSSTAWWIILSLQFFDCEPSEIFRVLQSYEMGGTISEVARIISDDNLPNYRAFAPEDGPFMHVFAGIIRKVDFVNHKPVRSLLKHTYIPALTPKEIVGATTSDGQIIITMVKDGEILCYAQGLEPWTLP